MTGFEFLELRSSALVIEVLLFRWWKAESILKEGGSMLEIPGREVRFGT